ncbi:MAG: hypothetical protein IH997_10310, partial [Proteobacteria bacterium]|nr:hypothetical protein [Pseudomonadota bacterium]
MRIPLLLACTMLATPAVAQDMQGMDDMTGMDHGAMHHDAPAPAPASAPVDHAAMNHAAMDHGVMDHEGHG